jgi:hypothetical protein
MALKTLKDIMVEQSGGARVYPMLKEGKIPNTSDKIYLDAIGVIGRKIREEAKKWKDFILHETCGEESTNVIFAQTGWITYFFNLEDDD